MSARRAAEGRPAPTDTREGSEFDLRLTLESGQVFHWLPAGRGFVGVIGEVPVYVEQTGERLLSTPGREAMTASYFALDHRLDEIYASFPADPAMSAALSFCRGMRIIRQPLWECLATFITSSMKQVAHISQMSHAIRRRFGQLVDIDGVRLHTYPGPERLAQESEVMLRACGLGFRAKHLLRTARMIAAGEIDLDRLASMTDGTLAAELCRLPGVGPKVAKCVMLFGCGRLRAFPIDVWIERVLRGIYFHRKRRVTPARLERFCAGYFGPFGGYAQQYLFHHARKSAALSRRVL